MKSKFIALNALAVILSSLPFKNTVFAKSISWSDPPPPPPFDLSENFEHYYCRQMPRAQAWIDSLKAKINKIRAERKGERLETGSCYFSIYKQGQISSISVFTEQTLPAYDQKMRNSISGFFNSLAPFEFDSTCLQANQQVYVSLKSFPDLDIRLR